VRYRDIRTFNCIIYSIKRVNYDNKIILVNLWKLGKNSWHLWGNFTKKNIEDDISSTGKNLENDISPSEKNIEQGIS
jgi:hypothetical protein